MKHVIRIEMEVKGDFKNKKNIKKAITHIKSVLGEGFLPQLAQAAIAEGDKVHSTKLKVK